jgi:serine phosphatase RsbU (regulator of sigma subunit)/Tfp pilus assembly protein PilF
LLVPIGHLPCQQAANKLSAGDLETMIDNYLAKGKEIDAARCYIKLAYHYWEKENITKAANAFTEALKINEQSGNMNAIRNIHSNLGLLYLSASNYKSSISHFQKSIQAHAKAAKKVDMISDMINLGQAYSGAGDYTRAANTYLEALQIAKEMEHIKLMKTCYGLLAEVYEKMGQTEKSFNYYDKYATIQKHLQQQEIDKMENITNLAREETHMKDLALRKTEKTLREIEIIRKQQQMEIELLNKEKQLQKMVIREKEARQKAMKTRLQNEIIIRNSVIGLVFFLLIIVGLLIFGFRQKQKDNRKLASQNNEILTQRDEIDTKNKKITQSITYAKRIQTALIPEMDFLNGYFSDHFIFFRPRDIVSGDFYWYAFLDENDNVVRNLHHQKTRGNLSFDRYNLLIAAVDCTGHGVPGAFMSMIGINQLNEIISHGITRPDMVLKELHARVRTSLKQEETENRDGMEISICKIMKKKGIMEFAGASSPLVYFENGDYTMLKGDIFPVGGYLLPGQKITFNLKTVTLSPSGTYYLFSDGFRDQLGGNDGSKYMIRKFKGLLQQVHTKPMHEQQQDLENELNQWKGDYPQVDDILIMGFKM